MRAILILLFPFSLFAIEKLDEKYQIRFGNETAPIKVIQYFSFHCPHCLSLFRKEFSKLRDDYIDSGKVCWTFHPIPMDLITVQAMDCLQKLSEKEKRVFLKAILEVIPIDDQKIAATYMEKAMELFEKPVPSLQEKDYLAKTDAFQDAFQFLKQKEKIQAVPVVEIDGNLFLRELPDLAFIEKTLRPLLTGGIP